MTHPYTQAVKIFRAEVIDNIPQAVMTTVATTHFQPGCAGW